MIVEAHRIGGRDAGVMDLTSILGDFGKDAARRRAVRLSDGNLILGPVTPYPLLNDLLGGSWATGLHFVHGGPGVGKTAFALQVAAACRAPALYLTCEMSPVEILRRMAARVAQKERRLFSLGEIPAEYALEAATAASQSAPLLRIMDGTREAVSLDQVAEQAGRLIEDCALSGAYQNDDRHLLIVIDSFHTWAGTNEPDELAAKSKALLRLAKSIDCPIMALAERSKDGKEDTGAFGVSGFRGAAYDAETVIALDRSNKDARPCHNADGEVEVALRISKNRQGEEGSLPMLFSGKYQWFRQKDQRIEAGIAVPQGRR